MDPELKHIGSREAREGFRDLLDDVAMHGDHIQVERHGKPAAVIVPVEWYEQTKQAISGRASQ